MSNTGENENSPNLQTGELADDNSTDNTITEDMDDLSNEGSPQKLTAAEKARLASLKTMLDASNARYQQASKNRRPVFAAGLEVKVVNGDHAGEIGIVLDADYIANRALISLPEQESPRWIGFRSLGHSD